jgi:hypothetical protein
MKKFGEFLAERNTEEYSSPEYVCKPAEDDKIFFYLKGQVKRRYRLVLESEVPDFSDVAEVKGNVFHTAPPKLRMKIQREGLLPMVGDSYSLHYEEVKGLKPAIFASKEKYDSTWDDDIWEINTEKANVTWYVDTGAFDGCIVTFQKISPECIRLIYRGTGESH